MKGKAQSTVDLLVLTSLNQLPLNLKGYLPLSQNIKHTSMRWSIVLRLLPSVSIPWCGILSKNVDVAAGAML
jgi:hypothetical protein